MTSRNVVIALNSRYEETCLMFKNGNSLFLESILFSIKKLRVDGLKRNRSRLRVKYGGRNVRVWGSVISIHIGHLHFIDGIDLQWLDM